MTNMHSLLFSQNIEPDPGPWIQDPGSRILDPGSWLQDPGSWILDAGSWTFPGRPEADLGEAGGRLIEGVWRGGAPPGRGG